MGKGGKKLNQIDSVNKLHRRAFVQSSLQYVKLRHKPKLEKLSTYLATGTEIPQKREKGRRRESSEKIP